MTRDSIHVDPTAAIGPVDRRLYGHFLEHFGRMIRGGVLAEPGSKAETTGIGYRTDVLGAARELGATNVRWPAGCFADTTTACSRPVGPKGARSSFTHFSIPS